MYPNRRRKNLDVSEVRTKKLRIESLEERRMLATMLVTDLGDGSLGSLAGDGQLSLREAVEAINTGAPVDGIGPVAGTFGISDTIIFQASLFGGAPQTLALTDGPLSLASGVSITGPVGNLLTIDAQQNSRIFDIAQGTDDYTFAQVTLTGGFVSGLQQRGGAVNSLTTGRILVRDSSIINNSTEGTGSSGGGIFTLGGVSLTRSTVADNTTDGIFAGGGGISSDGVVTVTNSTVSGNRTLGAASSAAGILGVGGVELTESTVSGNSTAGDTSSAAGVSSSGTITVTRSTIVNNHAAGANAAGGGLLNGAITNGSIVVSGSIVANNTAGGGGNDIAPGVGTLTVDYSLIGDATGLGVLAATNLLNLNPILGTLSNNGGPTETHLPLAGSPVVDTGDPSIASPPAADQRGGSFARIANGDGVGGAVIDMGSVELQTPSTANADFDGDNDIDGSDFLRWQRGAGTLSGANPGDGDSDQDGDVDLDDLGNWLGLYGTTLPLAGVSSPLVGVTSSASLIDLAIAVELTDAGAQERDLADVVEPVAVAETSPRQQVFAALTLGRIAGGGGLEDLASALASQQESDQAEALVDELLAAFE